MFRRIITASLLNLVTKISLSKLTLLKISLRGLGIVLLAMGLPVSTAAAVEVTLTFGGTLIEDIDPTGQNNPTFNYSAVVMYNTNSAVPTAGAVTYPGVTITLNVDGQVIATNTTSRIILEDNVIGGPDGQDPACTPPDGTGDSLQIGDEGDNINDSGWKDVLGNPAPFFDSLISGMSLNFADCDGSAFDLGTFDASIPFLPTIGIFDRTFNGSLNLESRTPDKATFFFEITSVTQIIVPDVLAVDIDIHPGSFPNSINLGSGGATPVAVLGSETLDVNDIDVDTLVLASAGIKTVGKTMRLLCSSGESLEDVNGDGFLDLVCHFITVDIVSEAGDTEATLSGNLLDGTAIEGTDSVNIIP